MHQTATNLLGHSTCHHTQVFDRTHIRCLLLPRHGSPLPDLPGQNQFSPKVLKCTVSFLHRVIDYVYVAKCLCVCVNCPIFFAFSRSLGQISALRFGPRITESESHEVITTDSLPKPVMSTLQKHATS